jgi:hypothetical protein
VSPGIRWLGTRLCGSLAPEESDSSCPWFMSRHLRPCLCMDVAHIYIKIPPCTVELILVLAMAGHQGYIIRSF